MDSGAQENKNKILKMLFDLTGTIKVIILDKWPVDISPPSLETGSRRSRTPGAATWSPPRPRRRVHIYPPGARGV